MIALVGIDLSAEDPIGIGGVGEDQRHQDQRADEQEGEALIGCGCIPDRKRGWDDVGIETDAEADKTQKEKAEGREEWTVITFVAQASVEAIGAGQNQQGDNGAEEHGGPGKPTLEIDGFQKWRPQAYGTDEDNCAGSRNPCLPA